MTTHEVLKKAYALLVKKGGWIQGINSDGAGGYCASGAIHSAASSWDGNEVYSAHTEIRRATTGISVWSWNDSPSRKKSEVLAAFRKAIAATKPAATKPKGKK